MYAETTDYALGDMARLLSRQISGSASTCTTIRFYVHTYGPDIGTLNMYLLGNRPYYFNSPIWQRKENSTDEWAAQEITLLVSFDYTVRFTSL